MNVEICTNPDRIHFIGRTIWSNQYQAMFFNWTGSGFEFEFYGSEVTAEMITIADYYPTEGVNLPWITVMIDGMITKTIGLAEGNMEYLLYKGDKKKHCLRVVKRSEDLKGCVGLKNVCVNGHLLDFSAHNKKGKIEFIGDSITCGFGIEICDDNNIFHTSLEDGLATYAAICAEILDADYQCICISGIPLCHSYKKNFHLKLPEYPEYVVPDRAMESCYPYTDFYFQKEKEKLSSNFELWDFEKNIPDVIVVNLGTNDAFRIKASGFDKAEEIHFQKQYVEFIKMLRRYNGIHPFIMCTLGSMDYYLYDNIVNAVEDYKEETGDHKIAYMKFGGIYVQEEGIGALEHPGKITHQRMAHELADTLRGFF